jgi:hypothetical protein
LAYHDLPIDYSALPWVEDHFDAEAFEGFLQQLQRGGKHPELVERWAISARLAGLLIRDILAAMDTD